MNLEFRAGKYNQILVTAWLSYKEIQIETKDRTDGEYCTEIIEDYESPEETKKAFYGLMKLMKGEQVK